MTRHKYNEWARIALIATILGFFFSQPVLAENFDLIATDDDVSLENITIDQNNSSSTEDLILIIIPEETTSSTENTSTTITTTSTDEGTETVNLEELTNNQLYSTNLEEDEIVFPTTTIKLQIITYAGDLYNDNFIVTACAPSDSSTSTSLTPYCALQQIASSSAWDVQFSDYGGSKFLSSINEFNGSDFNWWAFFHNYVFASEALNQYTLNENENILLSYGTFPLKLEVSTTTPSINTTTTISIKEFGFDAGWNSAWLDSVSSTIIINDEEFFAADGKFDLFITTTTPYSIQAKKIGLIDSEKLFINPINSNQNTNSGNNNSGGSSTNNPPPEIQEKFDVEMAIDFLTSKQKENGQISSNGIFNDWAAIALGAYNPNSTAAEKMKKYLLSDPDPLAGMNQVSDYARRAMALMALNINPYSGTKTNYITKIIEKFDGTELFDGDSSNKVTCNDDIFGLLVLLNSGYTNNDDMVQKLTDFIISKQNNGAWSGVDLTAAAIQTLSIINSEKTSSATNQAKEYLKNKQKDNGGFGDEYGTSWAIQAINSLNENQNNWIKNNKTPLDYLISKQDQTNGNINTDLNDENNQIWATAFAIPAGLNKNWNEILFDFEKTQNGDDTQKNNTETPTTTPVTSTLEIATTTLEIITPTTTISITTIDSIATTTSIQEVNTITNKIEEISDLKFKILDYNKIKNESLDNKSSITNLQSEILSPATSTTPISPAKIAFTTSVSAAGGLGAYLAWRLLQSLL